MESINNVLNYNSISVSSQEEINYIVYALNVFKKIELTFNEVIELIKRSDYYRFIEERIPHISIGEVLDSLFNVYDNYIITGLVYEEYLKLNPINKR